ncbi:unnamed protein product [Arabidopsis lyrata]|uniref:Predicted protein n=1 Tax=Arabidopsis lyrata subsp. lyrata TaxID=81972 RepID=D7L570_ARALL|nr:predicted protein [Arabidopsis lyrata subsp. lyrata]CAH8261741.1 unnamed protein product [Arabidopsis lyrata]
MSVCSAGFVIPRAAAYHRRWKIKQIGDPYLRNRRVIDKGSSRLFLMEGAMLKSILYLELAERGGEVAAAHVKEVIHQHLSATSRGHVIHQANNWRPLPATR